MKNLVDYSSSETSDEEEKPPEKAQRKLPMLLPVQKEDNSKIKASPEDHQMRSRSFEHVEGK